jgi:hypothetical protein
MVNTKVCNGKLCNGKIHLASDFYTDKLSSDGLQSTCKGCQKAKQKESHEKNKKKSIDYSIVFDKVCKGKLCLLINEEGITRKSTEFSIDSGKHDGYQSYCKKCRQHQAMGKANNDFLDDPNATGKICNDQNCENKGKEQLFVKFNKSKSGSFGYANDCMKCRNTKRRKISNKRQTDGTKKCMGSCGDTKDVSEFVANKENNDGLRHVCKKCHVGEAKKAMSNFDGHVRAIFTDLISNAKRRGITVIDITREDILNLYKEQDGMCIFTGKKMLWDHLGEKINSRIRNPLNISVDRIDSKKGYTKDNIQLVCAIVNRMKMDMSNEIFHEYCGLIYNNPKPAVLFEKNLMTNNIFLKKQKIMDSSDDKSNDGSDSDSNNNSDDDYGNIFDDADEIIEEINGTNKNNKKVIIKAKKNS